MENFPDHKAARKLNAWVKTQCREDRNHECHGHEDKRQGPPPTQKSPIEPAEPATCRQAAKRYTKDLVNPENPVNKILGHSHNIQNNRTSEIQTALIQQLNIAQIATWQESQNKEIKQTKPIPLPGLPFASTPLSKHNLKLIENHRHRTTPNLNGYKLLKKDESTAALTCQFCQIHGNLIIEDVYHTCLECTLYADPS